MSADPTHPTYDDLLRMHPDEYGRADCGVILHVDDIGVHNRGEDGPCERCEEHES